MAYYFKTTKKDWSFDETIAHVKAALKEEGFGVLTEIDIKETLKNKLDVDFKRYKILGACNPVFAHKALQSEDKIGVFLPCNVVVTENDEGHIEVAGVDPIASMVTVENEGLGEIAQDVQAKMKRVIASLN